MLDPKYFADQIGELEKSLKRRNASPDILSRVSELAAKRKEFIHEIEKLKAQRNSASQEIAQLKAKSKTDPEAARAADEKVLAMRAVGDQIKLLEEKALNVNTEFDSLSMSLPNIPHASVPDGKGAEDNREAHQWGKPATFSFAPKDHVALGEGLGILDFERAGPGEDAGDRVGAGRAALLVLAIVARHSAMRGLAFDDRAVGVGEHAGHQPQRAEALGHDVALHVAVVVLAGPDVAAVPLQRAGDHVVDQPMLVGDAELLELGFELGVVDLLEGFLEHAVIGLEDRVLRREVDGILARDAVVEAGAGKTLDRGEGIVDPQGDAGAFEVMDLQFHRGAAVGRHIVQGDAAGAGNFRLGGAVDIAIGVAADDDRLIPMRHQARDILTDDRLPEDGAVEDVADGAVRAPPHLLELELGHPRLVRGDRGAFHADAILLDGIRGIDGDLVIGLVTVFDTEIIVFEVDVEVGENELLLDESPDDACHLVAIQFDDGGLHRYFRHVSPRKVGGFPVPPNSHHGRAAATPGRQRCH